jgi:hypothetical protein
MLQWILVCTVGLVLASAGSAPAFAVDAPPTVICCTWYCENGGGSPVPCRREAADPPPCGLHSNTGERCESVFVTQVDPPCPRHWDTCVGREGATRVSGTPNVGQVMSGSEHIDGSINPTNDRPAPEGFVVTHGQPTRANTNGCAQCTSRLFPLSFSSTPRVPVTPAPGGLSGIPTRFLIRDNRVKDIQ